MSGDFAIIGLGQFGRAVALSLVREGAAVLAIDQLQERAQMIEAEVDAVACADATNELHGRVLLAVGAHEIINPELQMGQRLARNLAHPTILEQIALDENTNLVELATPEQFIGRSQEDLDLRRRYGISVVAVRRAGQVLSGMALSDRLERGDRLVVVGPPASVRRVASLA